MTACSTHSKHAISQAPVEQKLAQKTVAEPAKAVEKAIAAPVVTAPTVTVPLEEKIIQKAAIKRPVVKSVHQKKSDFFALMKPIVVVENNHISQQRQQIIQLKGKKVLSEQDLATLKTVSSTYGISMTTTPDESFWDALLNRVNIIPVELALVQAANESAWGTSRFARIGNNYFGQWCFKKGCGIVPSKRDNGASHEVRKFNSAAGSVRAYMKNINTSHAYVELRKIRNNLQKNGAPIKAELLANGLKHYSERGMAYVKTIRSMVRSNRALIDQVDTVKLVQGDAR